MAQQNHPTYSQDMYQQNAPQQHVYQQSAAQQSQPTYSQESQPTYSQEVYQQNLPQQQVYPLPNNFLETEDNPNSQDSMVQQRIISGEYAPEPAEYCNVVNEPVYAQYDPFQPSFTNQPTASQHYYQQNADSFASQYGQIEDPWIGQQDTNVYVQEDFDPTYREQFAYPTTEQAASSNTADNNPFEEEEPYEPTPIVQQMRRLGQPPAAPASGPITKTYKLVYARPQTIRPGQNAPQQPTVVRQPIIVQRPPRKQIVKREPDEDFSISDKDGTEKARSQAAQRLRTPEGWVQFNQWLKKAEKEKDRKKLVSLLELCLEADIPADLLLQKDIDTPKVVRSISRKHPNATINQLSNDLITMWKKTLTEKTKAPAKKAAEKSAKQTKEATTKTKETPKQEPAGDAPQYTMNENLLDMLTEAMDKRDDPTASTAPAVDDSKKPRTKAKVKLSKSRLTGLEAEEDPTAKTTKKDKPTKKKPVENVQPAAQKPAPVQKRQLQSSDMFMAAFDDAPKKTPPVKKLKVNKVVKVVQPDVPDGDATSPTIKSEFDIKPESTTAKSKETLAQIPIIPRNLGGGILRRQALTADEKSIRKIRFNDQFGKDLVQVRHFDVEEGERINVARSYDHNQIKRWEIEDEGKHFRHKGIDSEELTVDDSSMFTNSSSVKMESSSLSPTLTSAGRKPQMPPLPLSGAPSLIGMDDSIWNLLPLEHFDTFNRGVHSKLGKIEAEREQNSMAAFIDPNIATNAIDEDDSELNTAADSVSHDHLIRIPLILQHGDQQKAAQSAETMDVEPQTTRQNTVHPPLPFSAPTSSLSQAADTLADPHLEFQQSVLDNLPGTSPPLITTSSTTTSSAQPQNVDAFMELLKRQAAQVDQDLRPAETNDDQMDQDLRSPQTSNQPERMEYDQLDTPRSPPSEQNEPVKASAPAASSSSGFTLDTLSTLAALAGKDSNSMNAIKLVGTLDLASILSKVESAQSTNGADQQSQHQYLQEDGSAPSVITQVHDTYFQQANYSHQFQPRSAGAHVRYPSPGVRPTSTNPRAGYFQTPTNMSRFRTVPCKYFLAGTCNFGEACRFLHATPDGQIIPHKATASTYNEYAQEDVDMTEQQQEEPTSSFQLAIAPKNSTYSMEAAASYVQRGGPRGRGRGFRGGYRRGGYDERPSRNRDRRSPRRYDDHRRYSPSRRRRRSRSLSPNEGEGYERRRTRRPGSNSSDEESRKRRERSRSPVYDEKSPPRYERRSPDKEREAEERERSKSPQRSSHRSSRQESP